MGRLPQRVRRGGNPGRGHGRPCGGGDLAVTPVTGKIKSVDLMRHVITLENGSTYKVARGVNIKGTKAGQKVTVTTSGFGGTIEASAIAPSVD